MQNYKDQEESGNLTPPKKQSSSNWPEKNGELSIGNIVNNTIITYTRIIGEHHFVNYKIV